MADWKLTRRTDVCTRCERAFEEDEPLFSVLFVTAEEVKREDVCRACFTSDREEGGAFFHYSSSIR